MKKLADPIDNDVLFYEWCDAEGKNVPSHMELLSTVSGAPYTETMVWDKGWEKAFYSWVENKGEDG